MKKMIYSFTLLNVLMASAVAVEVSDHTQAAAQDCNVELCAVDAEVEGLRKELTSVLDEWSVDLQKIVNEHPAAINTLQRIFQFDLLIVDLAIQPADNLTPVQAFRHNLENVLTSEPLQTLSAQEREEVLIFFHALEVASEQWNTVFDVIASRHPEALIACARVVNADAVRANFIIQGARRASVEGDAGEPAETREA